jgi:hypothetical protein
MKKSEFREAAAGLINSDVDGLNWDQKVSLLRHVLLQLEKNLERDMENKGQPWSDEQLRVILASAPTRENCMLLARAFERGYGSIEQIFRWAAEDDKTVEAKRPDHAFIQQFQRVKKEVGWIAD